MERIIEKMSGLNVLILISIIVASVVLILALLLITKCDGKVKCKYDERQTRVRGKAYMMSFFTLLVYCAMYGIIDTLAYKPFIEPLAAMVIGICISACVHVIYSVWNDAYFALNENPKVCMVVFLIIALVNVAFSWYHILNDDMITDGKLNYTVCNLVCAIMFAVLFVTLWLRQIHTKNESKGDRP